MLLIPPPSPGTSVCQVTLTTADRADLPLRVVSLLHRRQATLLGLSFERGRPGDTALLEVCFEAGPDRGERMVGWLRNLVDVLDAERDAAPAGGSG
jgi:hypothetical protein